MIVVFAPFLQLLPKIESGATKKKMVAPKKKMKNTKIPIEYRASSHVP